MLSIKDLFTKLIKSTRILPNYYNPNRDPDAVDDPSEKHLTSLNIEPDNSGSARLMLVPNSMPHTTESGKSPENGYVLHFNWDENKNFASQLFLGHNKGAELAHRNYVNGWTPWHTISYYPVEILSNANLNSATYMEFGDYYCRSDATVGTLTNCPTYKAFTMTVRDGLGFTDSNVSKRYLYRIQTIIDRLGEKYVRTMESGDYGATWTFSAFGWVKEEETMNQRTTKSASGTVTVNSSGYKTLCTLTFPAYSGTWLILSHTWSNNGSSFETVNEMILSSGTPAVWQSNPTRTTTGYGQGTPNWGFLVLGSTAVTITQRCYGYYTTSHTEGGRMVAIKL